VFAAIAVTGALVFIRSSRPVTRPRIDVAGALLGGLGVFLIVFGFAHAETAGWSAALTVGSLVLGVLLIAALGLAERRVRYPLLPLRLILDRTRGGAYLSVGVAAVALFGAFLFLTYYLQTVKGYSPVTAGLAFLPMIGGLLVSANVSSNVLLPRIGPRILISSGLLTGAAAMAYLTQLSVTSSYARGVLPALILLGLAFGMILAPAIKTATTGVRAQHSGVASALVNTMQQVGGSIGASALSTVALSATAGYLAAHPASPLALEIAAVHGYTVAFTVSAALFALGAVLAFTLPTRAELAQRRSASVPAAARRRMCPPPPAAVPL
jgi:hypothetical protein